MEKIIYFVKSLFSEQALLGFIVGIAIGFITLRIINITPEYNIDFGEFFGAILVSLYFWIYCEQVRIKCAKKIKFFIIFLIVSLLSFGGLGLIRMPIMLWIAGGEEKKYPPYDTLSYMIIYGIICVFIGGLIETIWNIKKDNNSQGHKFDFIEFIKNKFRK